MKPAKLPAKLKEKFFALLPLTAFFIIALLVVKFTPALMLEANGILRMTSVSVLIGVIILGNAVLIADMLPFT